MIAMKHKNTFMMGTILESTTVNGNINIINKPICAAMATPILKI